MVRYWRRVARTRGKTKEKCEQLRYNQFEYSDDVQYNSLFIFISEKGGVKGFRNTESR